MRKSKGVFIGAAVGTVLALGFGGVFVRRHFDVANAIVRGDVARLEQMRKLGMEVCRERDGEPSLAAAVGRNKRSLYPFLIAHCDVNGVTKTKRTALMFAAFNGDVETLAALMAKNAQVNAQDDHGKTALMLAAAHSQASAVELLVRSGADMKVRNTFGRTALNEVQSALRLPSNPGNVALPRVEPLLG